MPGKVNPVMCEMVIQVGAQVIGNDATIAFIGSDASARTPTSASTPSTATITPRFQMRMQNP